MSNNHFPDSVKVTDHGIDNADISAAAMRVIRQLQEAGYSAYLVGGAVRDLLLGRHPKDFDVATDATPEQVKAQFHNCRLIGRRFRLAHVYIKRQLIEVATFRGSGDSNTHTSHEHKMINGRIVRDNVFGDEQEDAMRRDFTVNAMFYDPLTSTVIDYAGGLQDIRQRRLRMIGDTEVRYREDPVRMLRAARFASSCNLQLDDESLQCIPRMAKLLQQVAPARLFDEVCKVMLSGHSYAATCTLLELGLFKPLFPDVPAELNDPEPNEQRQLVTNPMLEAALRNSDRRVADGLPVTPGFLFAVLLWEPLLKSLHHFLQHKKLNDYDALIAASDDIVYNMPRVVSMPRKVAAMCREIWIIQRRFARTRGKRVRRLISERRFRAAYDFLLLRTIQEPELKPLADWWTQVQTLDKQPLQKAIEHGMNNNPDSSPSAAIAAHAKQ